MMIRQRGLGYTFPEIGGGSSSGGAWWQDLIKTGSQIALNRFGTPPAGTFIQDAQGNVYSRSVPGAVPYPSGVGVGVGVGGGLSTSTLLIGAAVVGAFLLLGGRKGG